MLAVARRSWAASPRAPPRPAGCRCTLRRAARSRPAGAVQPAQRRQRSHTEWRIICGAAWVLHMPRARPDHASKRKADGRRVVDWATAPEQPPHDAPECGNLLMTLQSVGFSVQALLYKSDDAGVVSELCSRRSAGTLRLRPQHANGGELEARLQRCLRCLPPKSSGCPSP